MKKKTIALIEDEAALAKIITEELTDAGFSVVLASDGIEGVNLVKTRKPDLVLLDLLLPKKHGFDVLKELKNMPDTATIPVIILTLLGSDEDVSKGLELGADDYLVKSQYGINEIIEKVKQKLW